MQIPNASRADNAFILGFGNSTVTLSNSNPDSSSLYTDSAGTNSTATPVVTADAVMFVPLDNTGSIMGTPLLVRQMNVLTSAGTYQPRATSSSSRTA